LNTYRSKECTIGTRYINGKTTASRPPKATRDSKVDTIDSTVTDRAEIKMEGSVIDQS
jgi:hypothetical protein